MQIYTLFASHDRERHNNFGRGSSIDHWNVNLTCVFFIFIEQATRWGDSSALNVDKTWRHKSTRLQRRPSGCDSCWWTGCTVSVRHAKIQAEQSINSRQVWLNSLSTVQMYAYPRKCRTDPHFLIWKRGVSGWNRPVNARNCLYP